MPSLTQLISNESDLAKNILNECRLRVRESERKLTTKHKAWRQAEEKALAYLPEREVDAIRRANREGNGMPEFTTIQIPYSYAVLMAAHTYLTSVFLGRSPVYQFTGRHGETQQQVQAMEALIDYQVMVGGALVPIYTWLYDACKYGVGIIGLYWEERTDNVSSITQEDVIDEFTGRPTGQKKKILRTTKQKTYSGNKVYNIQPWDFLWDTRYTLRDFQKGEYCAYRVSLSWNDIKRREAQGYYTNVELLKGTGRSPEGISNMLGAQKLERPESLDDGGSAQWGQERNSNHPMMVKGYEVYIDLIPSEWKLSSSGEPEKWVFTVTRDFKVVLGAQPLGALHSKFPAAVLPLEPEGYGLTTRGYPEILEPVQNTIDWLLNSHFFNVRSALNNRIIVDPSRVVMKDVLNPLPGGVIRLKPEAYGTDTKAVWSQMVINDVTQNHLRDFQIMLGVGERTVGINDQILGMLGGAGRKTATEIRTSTSFGVNRLKTNAEWFSAVGFDPLAQMLVQNTQQYYDMDMKFKVAGDLLGSAGPAFLQINSESITGFYDFVPVDGTLPIDRYAQANLWRELLGQMRNFPQLMVGYDLVGIFEWVAQLTGLKNITRFKVQVSPDAQLDAQVAAGNSVGTAELGKGSQVSGMGV
jgi:hypothetical protein